MLGIYDGPTNQKTVIIFDSILPITSTYFKFFIYLTNFSSNLPTFLPLLPMSIPIVTVAPVGL